MEPGRSCRRALAFIYFAAGWWLVGMVSGCAPPTTASDPADRAAKGGQPEASRLADAGDVETWSAIYLKGNKVGRSHMKLRTVEKDGKRSVEGAQDSRMTIVRNHETIEPEIKTRWVENESGELSQFHHETKMADAPTVIAGEATGGRLKLTTSSAGKVEKSEMAWAAGTGGFLATELSLSRTPMKPGERRTLKQLDAAAMQVVDIEMQAVRYEPTRLLDHTEDLLRIERTIKVAPGQSMQHTLWTDRNGEVWKSRFDALATEEIRCTMEQANAADNPGQFDLLLNNSVETDQPIANSRGTKRVRYLVQIKGDDAAKRFEQGASQQVKSLGNGAAELTVRAIRPDTTLDKSVAVSPPTEEDLAPNPLIQSDDAKVIELAKQAAGNATDPWTVAVKLESFVHGLIKVKDFSQGFASAAEVATNPVGDCTEHAVLLAALARANKIPARVAIGLVYVAPKGFYYHMWAEVWIKDRWVPLDGTIGQGGTSASYLKITTSSLKGASAFSSFLPVAQVMGRLKVKVLEVD